MALPATPPAVREFEAGGETAGKLCSICQTNIIAGERACNCPHCGLPFHTECWNENRGCSAYGCESAPKDGKADAVHQEPLSNAWGGEKPCPECGRTIKAQALKCRFCGASFDTRNVISRDEYVRREYEGGEYISARNKVVFLFLLSAAGCLAPVGLGLSIALKMRQKFWGMEYLRLPTVLRALVIASIGVASLLLLLLVLLITFD